MICGVLLDKSILCLLETGSMNTMIQRRALLRRCNLMQSGRKGITTMANRWVDKSLIVCLKSIVLTEFVKCRVVDGVREAQVFDSPHYQYNIIFGRNSLGETKM